MYDYALAEKEFSLASDEQNVLGARAAVFPEEKIQLERENINSLLVKLPNYRDGLLRAVVLAWRIYDDKEAKNLWEKANKLDPNNQLVKDVGKLLFF